MEVAEIIIKAVALIVFLVVAKELATKSTYETTVDGNKVEHAYSTKRKTAHILIFGFLLAIITHYSLNLIGFLF